MKKILMWGALSAILAACGQVSVNAPSKGNISQDRTAAFKSFMPTVSSMRKMANGDDAFDDAKFKELAVRFVQEARVPFESFQSDPDGNGDALPVIWQKPEEFEAEKTRFLTAADALNEAAQSGDLTAIKAAFSVVENSCRSCHESYRAPK